MGCVYRKMVLGLMVLMVAATSLACSASRDSALVQTDKDLLTGKVQGDMAAAVAEGDAMWAERIDRAKLEGAIAKWEEAAQIASEGMSEAERRTALYDIHLKLTRAYYFLADSHIRLADGDEDSLNQQMMGVFNKGVTASEKALAIYSPQFAEAIRLQNMPMGQAIKMLDKGAAPALYWYSTNLGKWALLEGFATILAQKDTIKEIMDQVESQDPEYFHGAAYRYFGAYYTKLPFPGGDLPKSASYFDKAVKASPNYLATRVLMAEMHSTKAEDKEAFKKHLQFVLDFDLEQAPEIKPENEFEQRKAKRLMDKMNELF